MEAGVVRWLAAVTTMCSSVKHRPASLIPGWVTAQVLSDEFSSPPHIHTCVSRPTLTPLQHVDGHIVDDA